MPPNHYPNATPIVEPRTELDIDKIARQRHPIAGGVGTCSLLVALLLKVPEALPASMPSFA
jgi:hypothetical protein